MTAGTLANATSDIWRKSNGRPTSSDASRPLIENANTYAAVGDGQLPNKAAGNPSLVGGAANSPPKNGTAETG